MPDENETEEEIEEEEEAEEEGEEDSEEGSEGIPLSVISDILAEQGLTLGQVLKNGQWEYSVIKNDKNEEDAKLASKKATKRPTVKSLRPGVTKSKTKKVSDMTPEERTKAYRAAVKANDTVS